MTKRTKSITRTATAAAGLLCVAGLIGASPAAAQQDAQQGVTASATASGTMAEAVTLDELVGSTDYLDEYGDVLRLYPAFFGREAEVGGARYWISDYTNGRSLDDIAYDFASDGQAEFVTAYADIAADDYEGYLTRVYDNMLGRVPDEEGFAYWLNLMETGALERGPVVRWVAANQEYINLYPYEGLELECDDTAALFQTDGSANVALADPVSSAVCDATNITITSNGIPDYTYIATSPGNPTAQDYTFTIPAEPTMAAEVTAVPALGTAAVALNGVPIYGPTEGTGGDVLSLEGALSECGSHNGPTGFHIHLFGTSDTTDCIFTAAEVAASPQLLGYALDGYPIYTGNDQYTSSWDLTDESLFATDTWNAHSYVEGSGDLDECNGLTDADGNYAYYTTDTFPYVLGCYRGEVTLAAGA